MATAISIEAAELKGRIARFSEVERAIVEQVRRVIVGQEEVLEQVMIALFVGGHCLITGLPGTAKTLLVRTIAQTLGLAFKRIQFTPDLMPSDITGTDIIEEDVGTGKRVFRFLQGPVFANIILADEINRTPPKTQAALLQAMQEHEVTAGGEKPVSFFLPVIVERACIESSAIFGPPLRCRPCPVDLVNRLQIMRKGPLSRISRIDPMVVPWSGKWP
jgi:MoxR-like ATPase